MNYWNYIYWRYWWKRLKLLPTKPGSHLFPWKKGDHRVIYIFTTSKYKIIKLSYLISLYIRVRYESSNKVTRPSVICMIATDWSINRCLKWCLMYSRNIIINKIWIIISLSDYTDIIHPPCIYHKGWIII